MKYDLNALSCSVGQRRQVKVCVGGGVVGVWRRFVLVGKN